MRLISLDYSFLGRSNTFFPKLAADFFADFGFSYPKIWKRKSALVLFDGNDPKFLDV